MKIQQPSRYGDRSFFYRPSASQRYGYIIKQPSNRGLGGSPASVLYRAAPTVSLLMKLLSIAERCFLIAHVVSTLFGLAGLLLVLPHPEFIAGLSPFGQAAFGWSMTTGGAAYIIFGALAVSCHAWRTLGVRSWLTFLFPAVFLSLGSELLGTSTGFPFGDYQYLSGLGYKIAGLVPFTIPLSWFYMGLTCYLLARSGLESASLKASLRPIAAIALATLLLVSWDLVLDPAMSQSPFPFWQFQEVGAFFGMPYRNLSGWMATGALFMTVAWGLRGAKALVLGRSQLITPLIVYLTNFVFGAAITVTVLDPRFLFPTLLSVVIGVVPAFWLWSRSRRDEEMSPPSVAVVESRS